MQSSKFYWFRNIFFLILIYSCWSFTSLLFLRNLLFIMVCNLMNNKILLKMMGLLLIWFLRYWLYTLCNQCAIKQFNTWIWTHCTSGLYGFIQKLYVSIFLVWADLILVTLSWVFKCSCGIANWSVAFWWAELYVCFYQYPPLLPLLTNFLRGRKI